MWAHGRPEPAFICFFVLARPNRGARGHCGLKRDCVSCEKQLISVSRLVGPTVYRCAVTPIRRRGEARTARAKGMEVVARM